MASSEAARPMEAILVRHGAYSGGGADPGLSPHGFAQARALGRFLAGRGIRPDAAVTSDYRRAAETARTVLETLGADVEPIVSRDFAPWGDAGAMRAMLEGIGAGTVLAVGHMCAIGGLARTLCPDAPTAFGTCMAVALRRGGEGWELLWIREGETE